MAAIAVEPVILATTAIIETVVEKSVETAVVVSIDAAITEAIEAAVTSAVTAAIEAGIVSTISGVIAATTTEALIPILENNLNQAVKDVIGSQGIDALSKAITAIPSDVAVDTLVQAALDTINPHLWVFKDPAFLRLTRMIKVLRAIKKGEKPEDGDDDDDCDEEKCRCFVDPDIKDNMEDFIFFTVYGNSECEEGDEVYSMSAQWKKLKSLVDDRIGGHYVSQLFHELFESCVDDEEEQETDSLVLLAKMGKPNFAKVFIGKMVAFGNQKVYNIHGSSYDKRSRNWLRTFDVDGYKKCAKCYIASEKPVCGHTDPLKGNIVGGHMWSPKLKEKDKNLYYYILPICKRHNKSVTYDKPKPDGSVWLKTSPGCHARKITSTYKVPGWKTMKKILKGSKTVKLMATFTDENGGECPEILQPKELTNWVLEEVHNIALEFAKKVIDTVFGEVSHTVLGKLMDIIKSAGEDAKEWLDSEGNSIMLQSLIPFYGIYQAIKRLSSLKENALNRFHSVAQFRLDDYKNECLNTAEQTRRRQRLIEESNKVISSKKWKDRIVAFEETIASKVPSILDHSQV